MGIKKAYLTWEDVNKLLDTLHKDITTWNKVSNQQIEMFSKVEFQHVCGIPRGGSLLAILYSHRYGLKYRPHPVVGLKEQLIIDDISDSGDTLNYWYGEYPESKFATLHYKNTSSFKPDFFSKEIDKDYGWVVYPWEKEDSKTIQDYLDN